MNLTVQRRKITDRSCIGDLNIDSQFECYTLEDPPREKKIAGETAIPTGKYRIIIDWSDRFQRRMPLLLDVPSFEGIRIHPGNTDSDTEGCILVGQIEKDDLIGNSRLAFKSLFKKLDDANKREKIWIEVLNPKK